MLTTLCLVLLFGLEDEWAQLPKQTPTPAPRAESAGEQMHSRYAEAIRLLSAGRAAEANTLLDALIATHPRVPELFTARAQAQLKLGAPRYAAADAQYALALKPQLTVTRLTLAMAEEALGNTESAARHYRAVGESNDSSLDATERAKAARRADRLHPTLAANTPAPIRTQLSAVAPALEREETTQAPECRMGTDGRNACGFNCRMGTNGKIYCASRPDGRCAFNTDGTFTCP